MKVRKGREGAVRIRFEPEEAALVRTLTEQLLDLLGDPPGADDELAAVGITDRASAPDDPVLARLFPDAYRDDGEAAGEFRRYTEMGLRDGKREAAGIVLATLADAFGGGLPGGGRAEGRSGGRGRSGEVELTTEQAQAWLRSLNDVRLALGTRLDISEEWYEEAERLDPSDPRMPMYAAYDWLTMLQESLVRAVW
ncbi:DUF2017 domain-containing protein [Actinomadura logoneensis]|uniref:DUF2017 domain-containing protein n=1 Tax=Actinomadura logoneensis TaxID=2293572 RepID=A0A372JS68_9ACTN|nr:DUF2017 domain-containing protein [Actinomadura logoneensis]RFU42883.1 DUF2017 domain-containing protein [Actinomadura logoneensis]